MMESNKNGNNVKSSGKEVNFQWFFVSFFIYWKWFLLSIILFLLVGFLQLRYAVPAYNVQARIVLKDNKRGGLSNSELSVFENMGVLEAGKNVENEVEVLSSRNLIESVVVQNEFFIRYIVKGQFKDTELYGNANSSFYFSPPVKVFVDKDVVAALKTAIILKVSAADNNNIQVVGYYGNKEFSGEYSSLPGALSTPIGELILMADSRSSLRKEYPLEIQIVPPLWVAEQYQGSLRMSLTSSNTTVVLLTFKETIPKRGEDFLTGLIDQYNKDAMEDKNKAANSAARFIDGRLAELSNALIDAEQDVQTYKQRNNIADLDVEAGLVIGEKNEYDKQLIEIGSKKLLLSYLEEEIQKNSDGDPIELSSSLPAGVANLLDGTFASSLEHYNQALLEKSRLMNVTSPETPIFQRINERISTLLDKIHTNIQSLQYSLNVQQKDLEQLSSLYGGAVYSVPRKERELADILRQALSKGNLYVNLLQKKEEIGLTLAVTAPTAMTLEDPLCNGTPVSPRKMYTYMLSLLGGVLFPFLIIGIRELFNYKISNEEEVRRFSEVPVIVSLPMVKTKETLVITPHSTTAIAERFKLLRTNLQFVLDSPEKKVVLVTSTISGEGKTFISINAAMTFSLRYKTILVGLDIRRPKINAYLDVPKDGGIISYLTGTETDIDMLINKEVNDTNLDVLISGIVPPNPNELLMEKTLDDLFAVLREKYDYIIVDTSPVGSVSDAFLVNRVCDVSLFVVRGGYSPKSSLALLDNIHKEKRLNNVNIVLNAFNAKNSSYGYGYGYGYGGGYGYGYGGGYGYGYPSK